MSRTFLSSNTGFIALLRSSRYLTKDDWLIHMPRDPDPPTTVQQLQGKIIYQRISRSVFSTEETAHSIAAVMNFVPALGRREVLNKLWLLIEQLSFVSQVCRIAQEIYESVPRELRGLSRPMLRARFEEEIGALRQQSVPSRRALPKELMPILQPVLDLFEEHWFNSSSLLFEEDHFRSADSFKDFNPRVLCAEGIPDQTIEVKLIQEPLPWSQDRLPRPPELALEAQRKREEIETSHLIFSGGFHTPIEVPLVHADFSSNAWVITIRSAEPLERTDDYGKIIWRIQSGPINFAEPMKIRELEKFLREIDKTLDVATNRFWLPWDKNEENLLWIGPPIVFFDVPEWMYENVSSHSETLELWGAEDLKVWFDEVIVTYLSRPIEHNHEFKEIYLLRTLEQSNIVTPRRYDVHILATNGCGSHNEYFNTGVTYPLKIRWLGTEDGQTISRGSTSEYSNLVHQPAVGSYPSHIDHLSVPIVRNKPTWIRLFFEHDAPFDCLPARLRFTITREEDGESRSGSVTCSINNEAIHPAGSSDQIQHFHELRTQLQNDVVSIPLASLFPLHEGGTYVLSGTIDIDEPLRTEYGLFEASMPVYHHFTIQDPNIVKLYWIRWIPGRYTTGTPVTNLELSVLEEWLQAFVPSIRFDFNFGGTVQVGRHNRTDDDLLAMVENVQGGRDGFWVAVIDEELASYCDESIMEPEGSSYHGSRKAWVKLLRNELLDNARNIAHEFCHAHPNEYDDVKGPPCVYPSDAIPGYYYWKPGLTELHPRGSCGESLFIPGKALEVEGVNEWFWPSMYTCEITDTEYNREIMTYCHMYQGYETGFELMKCILLKEQFGELR